MWEDVDHRLTLLELLETGKLPRRHAQFEAWEWLSQLSWTRTSTRRNELLLDPRHRSSIEELLDHSWPEWRPSLQALKESGLPPTPKGWQEYRDRERARQLGEVPGRINQRTAAAAIAEHSKATLTASRLAALGDPEVTRDGSIRMRPPQGLILRRGDRSIEATQISDVLGELAISERALRDGLEISGPIDALLLVENLGAFQDLTAPRGWLVAHVPGWNTATVVRLLDQLKDVPAVHFGDLDPNGARILRHLRSLRPNLAWAVPSFWAECVPDRALRADWPRDLDLVDAPELVRRLAREGLWLEQETIVLDERLENGLLEAAAELADQIVV
jgi:hypothetical protein